MKKASGIPNSPMFLGGHFSHPPQFEDLSSTFSLSREKKKKEKMDGLSKRKQCDWIGRSRGSIARRSCRKLIGHHPFYYSKFTPSEVGHYLYERLGIGGSPNRSG